MADNLSEKKITEEETDILVLTLVKGHLDTVTVKEDEFVDLLKHSLSLSAVEKKRVIDAVPILAQFQFDKLTEIFTNEREKFRELASEHPDDIKKLVAKQQREWVELGEMYVLEGQRLQEQALDQNKIDDIKSNLGL